jgi:hypothetical protein
MDMEAVMKKGDEVKDDAIMLAASAVSGGWFIAPRELSALKVGY